MLELVGMGPVTTTQVDENGKLDHFVEGPGNAMMVVAAVISDRCFYRSVHVTVSPSVVNPGGACASVVWMPRTRAGNRAARTVVITPPQSPPWATNRR